LALAVFGAIECPPTTFTSETIQDLPGDSCL